MSCPSFRSSLLQDGQPVDAGLTQDTLQAVLGQLSKLLTKYNLAAQGQSVVAYCLPVSPDTRIGQPVYYNAVGGRWEPAWRSLSYGDGEQQQYVHAECSKVWGLVCSKSSSTIADIFLAGTLDLNLSACIDGTILPGQTYFLSPLERGKLITDSRTWESVRVLHVNGPGNARGTWSVTLDVAYHTFQSHQHFQFDLQTGVAGELELSGGVYAFTTIDPTIEGWLPADHVSLGTAPTGAEYGYNIPVSRLSGLWPPEPLESAYLQRNNSELTGFGLPADLCVVDAEGIWWMDNCPPALYVAPTTTTPEPTTTTTTTTTTTAEPTTTPTPATLQLFYAAEDSTQQIYSVLADAAAPLTPTVFSGSVANTAVCSGDYLYYGTGTTVYRRKVDLSEAEETLSSSFTDILQLCLDPDSQAVYCVDRIAGVCRVYRWAAPDFVATEDASADVLQWVPIAASERHVALQGPAATWSPVRRIYVYSDTDFQHPLTMFSDPSGYNIVSICVDPDDLRIYYLAVSSAASAVFSLRSVGLNGLGFAVHSALTVDEAAGQLLTSLYCTMSATKAYVLQSYSGGHKLWRLSGGSWANVLDHLATLTTLQLEPGI